MTDDNFFKLSFGIMKGLIFGVGFLLLWLVSGVHLGFWGILIFAGIVLFPILQFKIPLTARLPSWKKAAGAVVALVILLAILYYPALFGWLVYKETQGRTPLVYDASTFEGLAGWKIVDGKVVAERAEGERVFIFSPGASIKKEFEAGLIASVALYNPKPVNKDSSAQLEIFVKDQYDYSKDFQQVFRRDAKAEITVTENKVSFSETVGFGNQLKQVKLSPDGNWPDENHQENYFSLVVNQNHITSTYGSEGNFSLLNWVIYPEGYKSRKIKRPFSVTVSNPGNTELEIDDIVVLRNP